MNGRDATFAAFHASQRAVDLPNTSAVRARLKESRIRGWIELIAIFRPASGCCPSGPTAAAGARKPPFARPRPTRDSARAVHALLGEIVIEQDPSKPASPVEAWIRTAASRPMNVLVPQENAVSLSGAAWLRNTGGQVEE